MNMKTTTEAAVAAAGDSIQVGKATVVVGDYVVVASDTFPGRGCNYGRVVSIADGVATIHWMGSADDRDDSAPWGLDADDMLLDGVDIWSADAEGEARDAFRALVQA